MTSPAPDVERWSALKVWLFSLFNKNPESNLSAVDRMGLGSDDRFLDLGCGLGAALEHATATGAKTAGIDPSPSMVERAAERVPRAEVRLGSAESIPFEDDTFTAALAVSDLPPLGRPGDRAEGGTTCACSWRPAAHRREEAEAELRPRLGRHRWRVIGEAAREPRVRLSGQVETMKIGRKEYLAVSAVVP